jgi:hypothetical protein
VSNFKPFQTFVRDEAGVAYLSKAKDYVRDFHLNLDGTGTITLGPAGTPTAIQAVQFSLSDEFHFEAVKLSAQSDNPFLISFYWQGGNSDLMNRPVDSRLICGNGEREYPFPTTLWMRARSVLKMTIENLSPMPNRVRPILHGRAIFYKLALSACEDVAKWIAAMDCKVSFPFWLSTDQDPVTNLNNWPDTWQGTATIDPNYVFEAHHLQGFADNDTEWQIQDPLTARNWTNKLVGGHGPCLATAFQLFLNPLPFAGGFQGNGAGWGQYRHPMVEPVTNFMNSKLQVGFEEVSGLHTPNRIRFCLAGRYIRAAAGSIDESRKIA